MIKVGIIGGAGYSAGELVRVLLYHPEVEIMFITSKSHPGKLVSEVHRDLIGETSLRFGDYSDVDVVFITAGHGKTKEILDSHDFGNTKIIDLSADFRLDPSFEYGLPELALPKGPRVANPGCFATAIQLGLLPMAKRQLLNNEVHIHAITGSTGAGQSLAATTHFTWRNSNVSVYKPFHHQHLAEISSTLNGLQEEHIVLNFIPVRGPFTRGIFASIYTDCEMELAEVIHTYESYYENAPFTFISTSEIDLKQVVNTNKCLIHLDKFNSKLLITVAIDNLLKGASGQAVQNMNILFGLDERTGLKLKSNYF